MPCGLGVIAGAVSIVFVIDVDDLKFHHKEILFEKADSPVVSQYILYDKKENETCPEKKTCKCKKS